MKVLLPIIKYKSKNYTEENSDSSIASCPDSATVTPTPLTAQNPLPLSECPTHENGNRNLVVIISAIDTSTKSRCQHTPNTMCKVTTPYNKASHGKILTLT